MGEVIKFPSKNKNPDVSQWDRLHTPEHMAFAALCNNIELKIHHLVQEGLIESGTCEIDDRGAPMITIIVPES